MEYVSKLRQVSVSVHELRKQGAEIMLTGRGIESDENARIFAAAPEMLRALEAMESVLDSKQKITGYTAPSLAKIRIIGKNAISRAVYGLDGVIIGAAGLAKAHVARKKAVSDPISYSVSVPVLEDLGVGLGLTGRSDEADANSRLFAAAHAMLAVLNEQQTFFQELEASLAEYKVGELGDDVKLAVMLGLQAIRATEVKQELH